MFLRESSAGAAAAGFVSFLAVVFVFVTLAAFVSPVDDEAGKASCAGGDDFRP